MQWVYYCCFTLSLAFIASVLHLFGAAEIRADPAEVVGLTVVGAVWLAIATKLFSWFGVSLYDDVSERKNGAALATLCGAVLALALIYAGSSAGEGPSYSNNFFCNALGMSAFFAFWVYLEVIGTVSRSVSEERDLASGLRLSGLFTAIGLILGRALAGDWESETSTIRDFIHDGWPTAILVGFAGIIESVTGPSRERPAPKWQVFGLPFAVFYLLVAVVWLLHLGAWEGKP